MSTKTSSTLILLGTLLLGGVLGIFLSGTLAQQRRDQRERLRRPGGFVEETERLLRPQDATQRDALRPFLEATDERNRDIILQAEEDLRTALREMAEQVDSLLDDDQRDRLSDAVDRGPPLGSSARGSWAGRWATTGRRPATRGWPTRWGSRGSSRSGPTATRGSSALTGLPLTSGARLKRRPCARSGAAARISPLRE